MKLTNLIELLITHKSLKQLYSEQKLNEESEAILIYMKDILHIDSEIFFFEIEDTDDQLEYEVNGANYIQLFPLNHIADLIESDLNLKNSGLSILQMAERLLEYRIKDA